MISLTKMDLDSGRHVKFSGMCRICLKKGSNFVSIFHTKRKDKTMADMLSICLQINIHQHDGKPAEICLGCVPKLMSTFEFLNTAKNSEQHFQQLILSTIGNQNIPYLKSAETEASLVITESDVDITDPLAMVEIKTEHPEAIGLKTEDNENTSCDEVMMIQIQESIKQLPEENLTTTPKVTNTKSKLRVSRRSKKLFECYFCKRQFGSLKKIQNHMKSHDNDKPFKCNVCGEKSRIKHNLYNHLCHGEKITCEYCPKEFNSTREIVNHLPIHKDQLLFYKCLLCTEGFNLKLLYTWHGKQHEQFQFACECGKKFETAKFLTNHKKRHTELRPHLCADCGRGFKDSHTLKNHLRVHSKEKPFQCPECHSKFRQKGNLKMHMSIHVLERHVCNICGTVAKSKLSLQAHIRRHGERKKQCKICSFKFFTNDKLRLHMRTHTGEKPEKCTYCEAAYAQKNDLIKHIKRTHLGENAYICNRCTVSFQYHADWKNHTRTCPPQGEVALS